MFLTASDCISVNRLMVILKESLLDVLLCEIVEDSF